MAVSFSIVRFINMISFVTPGGSGMIFCLRFLNYKKVWYVLTYSGDNCTALTIKLYWNFLQDFFISEELKSSNPQGNTPEPI